MHRVCEQTVEHRHADAVRMREIAVSIEQRGERSGIGLAKLVGTVDRATAYPAQQHMRARVRVAGPEHIPVAVAETAYEQRTVRVLDGMLGERFGNVREEVVARTGDSLSTALPIVLGSHAHAVDHGEMRVFPITIVIFVTYPVGGVFHGIMANA